jgi:hypothetical protein
MSAISAMLFGRVMTPRGQELPELKTRGAFVLVKAGDRWQIAHFQHTVVDLEAEQNDPVTWDETGYVPGRCPRYATQSRAAARLPQWHPHGRPPRFHDLRGSDNSPAC